MPDTIRVGVIAGAGGAHLEAYFDSLAQADEVEAVAVADPSGESLESAGRRLGDKLDRTYRDVPAMLRETQPAMALVSMEAALAPPAIDAALEANCHVLSEKPACVEWEDFQKLLRKADSKHRHLMLALANRIHPPVVEARRLIQEGKLGRIYGVEMHLIADQTRLTREEYRQSWFASRERAGGGHLIWLGIHWLDLARTITGLSFQDVAAFTAIVGGQPVDIEDAAVVAFRFDSGALGTLTSGYYLDQGYHSHLKIWGQHGWLRLADVEEEPLEWYSTQGTAEPQVQRFEYPKGLRGYAPFVRAAVRASAGLQEPPITGEECLHVLKTIFACYRAAESGATQRIG
jgi:predicted dehydrogenase